MPHRRSGAISPRPLEDDRVGLDTVSDFQHRHGAVAISPGQVPR
jgi:hypothetical protein